MKLFSNQNHTQKNHDITSWFVDDCFEASSLVFSHLALLNLDVMSEEWMGEPEVTKSIR